MTVLVLLRHLGHVDSTFFCIVHGKVSSVDPQLVILRWPFQGCDHVSNAHGGFIVYPIFAILSSSGVSLAVSPVLFAAS